MDIAVIAAVADVLAAVGVIGSLIFLAIQVKKNTQALRSRILDSHFDRVVANFIRPLDARVATVVARGKQSFVDLKDDEKVMFNAWASEYLVNANHLAIFAKQGLIEPQYAEMLDRRLRWFFKNPGALEWWEYDDRHPMPSSVEQIFNEKIEEIRSKPITSIRHTHSSSGPGSAE